MNILGDLSNEIKDKFMKLFVGNNIKVRLMM